MYGISNHSFYRYLQIRHALSIQFKTHAIEWSKVPLLQRVIKTGTSKGLISELFAQICSRVIEGPESLSSKKRSEEDIEEITTE